MPQTHTFFAPGRVNLIGEHIDYNGGLVMPLAIERGLTGTVGFRSDSRIRVESTHFPTIFETDLRRLPTERFGDWRDYVAGVLHHLHRAGTELRGFDLTIASDLPEGSGLSSSAALEVLVAFVAQFDEQAPNDFPQNGRKLAQLCQRVENEYVGVACGIMDQFAVANSRRDHAMLLDCATIRADYVPFKLTDLALVVIDSRQPRTLAGSAYNQRRAECEQALKIINRYRREPLPNLCAGSERDLVHLEPEADLHKRARHVITEQQRVIAAAQALRDNDLERLGRLLTASHRSLRDDYEVSSEALDFIVDWAGQSTGCLGSRLTGAGFGGCCLALIERATLPDFTQSLKTAYQQHFDLELSVFATSAADGVRWCRPA